MTILTGETIKLMCNGERPLIRNYINKDVQTQQNGFDLTIKKIERFEGSGLIDFDNSRRELPVMSNVQLWGKLYDLSQGTYLITFNEIVTIPKTLMARACPRSSLMRCGATMNTAVWDAGYEGQSQALLTVHNECGIVLSENARVAQIVFERLNNGVRQGYSGVYHREGVDEADMR
jgi:dUTP pyrophosphatase